MRHGTSPDYNVGLPNRHSARATSPQGTSPARTAIPGPKRAQQAQQRKQLLSQQPTLSKTIGGGKTTSPAAVMTRLWPYIRPLLGIVALGLIAMGFVAASEAGIPMLLKPLLDHGFGAHGSASAKWIVPAAVVGLAVVRGGMQYA